VSALLEAALVYAHAGLPVFPLHPRSKIPYGKPKPEEGTPGHFCDAPLHQHGHLDATTDPVVITALWTVHPDANIGNATGHGIDVLDIDGPEGEATLAALVATRWPLPETCEVRTGRPGGGRQLDFLSAGWPNTASTKLGPGLDTRGLGGFVLRPPSVHPSGAVYAFTNFSKPAPAPYWLTALLYRKSEPIAAPFVPRVRSEDDDSAIEQASRYLAGLPAAIEGQGGELATWNAARSMCGFSLTEAEAFALMWTEYNPRCAPPWRESDLRRKVKEVFAKARRIPHLLETTGQAS
jgi:hypothetical protein